MAGDLIRVALADDHAVIRAGLRAILGATHDIEVVGEATNGREAVALAERTLPDVLIMDLDMPEMDGRCALMQITARGLSARVLILSVDAEEEPLIPLMQLGAAGCVMKSAPDRELLDAVRTIALGGVYMHPSAAPVLALHLTQKDPVSADRARFEQLTPRERDVLQLVSRGFSAPEIGGKLFISPKTVDTYKQRIQEKLSLAHRSEYVQFALRLGLLTDN